MWCLGDNTLSAMYHHLRYELISLSKRVFVWYPFVSSNHAYFYTPQVLSTFNLPHSHSLRFLAFPAGVIFPCKSTASVQPSSTATLTGSRIERQPSQIEDELSVPRRVGYSVKSMTVSLPYLFFTRCLSCM